MPPIDQHFRLTPPSASQMADRVDALFWSLTAASAFVTLIVFVLVVYFAIKYRRRSADEVPYQRPPQTRLELIGSFTLLAIFLGFFVWGARLYFDMKRPPADALDIHVVGKQWMWKAQHPTGQREINELHVPVGQPVKLVMTSDDVIHSFGLPAFRIKQDVVPGSYSTQWFTAERPGVFNLLCQEFCGTEHSEMVGRVIAMNPVDYEAWLAGTVPEETPEVSGAKLFVSYGCIQCHSSAAPTMAGLFGSRVPLDDGRVVIADESYLRQSILNPSAQIVAGYPRLMPAYDKVLKEEQVADLIAYIKSLRGAVGEKSPDHAGRVDELPNLPPARALPGEAEGTR